MIVGHVLRRPGGNGGLDEDEALGADFFPDDLEALLQCGDVGRTLPHVPERLLVVVALNIDNHDVGECQDIVGERCHESLLLFDAATDERYHFGVLRLDGRDPLVEIVDLPVGADGRALHADDELHGFFCFPVRGVCDDARHDGADETHAHHDDDFHAPGALPRHDFPQPFELPHIITGLGKTVAPTGGADGDRSMIGLDHLSDFSCSSGHDLFFSSCFRNPRRPTPGEMKTDALITSAGLWFIRWIYSISGPGPIPAVPMMMT